MMEEKLIVKLIHEYEATANDFLSKIQQKFKIGNPVQAVIEKKIPREGKLTDQYLYKVHGIGIRFITLDETEIIDVDLAKNDSHIGFDAWRLFSFAKEKVEYKNLTKEDISQALEALVKQGKLQKSVDQMTSHLYGWCG